jgi:hypothetical protein
VTSIGHCPIGMGEDAWCRLHDGNLSLFQGLTTTCDDNGSLSCHANREGHADAGFRAFLQRRRHGVWYANGKFGKFLFATFATPLIRPRFQGLSAFVGSLLGPHVHLASSIACKHSH